MPHFPVAVILVMEIGTKKISLDGNELVGRFRYFDGVGLQGYRGY